MADHLLAEMLADCLCYSREKEYVDGFKIDLSVPTDFEVERASIRILREFERRLGPGFVYFNPLLDSKLRAIVDYYKLIILCSLDMYRAVLKAYPDHGFGDYIAAGPRMSRLDALLENSVEAIAHVLRHPDNPWEPRRWLPGGSNKFEYSVYEYERIWRPGRYKFGRKEGLLGAIYYSTGADRLISWSAGYAEKHDLWPLIRLAMGMLYSRGRSQWPVSSAFIRTLIGRRPRSVQETVAMVAKSCGLEKYPEVVGD
jgi:glycosyltransferase involved in cell wall biosynthesis